MISKGIVTLFFLILSHRVFAAFEDDFTEAALERTKHRVTYDGRYRAIDYPNGDVPNHIGVCTDVVIRTYRALGVDLQQLLHEDISMNFAAYPSKRIWGLNRADSNIDHRRVPNLQTFFERHGVSLDINLDSANFLPGDIVTWMLPGNLPHIGIVSNQKDSVSKEPLVVHNIGSGPKLDKMLFSFKITGHYRYVPDKYRMTNSSERETLN